MNSACFLTTRHKGKILCVLKLSKDLAKTFNASELLKEIIEPFGGKGGGKRNMAQGVIRKEDI